VEQVKTKRPRTDFFELFEAAAQNNVEAATVLNRLCGDFRDAEATVQRLHDHEHKGDDITHRMYESLHGVFMPPLDREDIIAIASRLDDVMDYIYEAGDAMAVYNVQAPTAVAASLAAIIVSCTEVVAAELPKLRQRRTMRGIEAGILELDRLEKEADAVLRAGVFDLFHCPHGPIQVIAWTRIYETMERVTDECEDIADVLRGVVIKHA